MFFQQHTINSARTAAVDTVTVQGTSYPIGFDFYSYMDFITDVKTIHADINGLISPIASFGGGDDTSLIGALDDLASSENTQATSATYDIDSTRAILPIGRVRSDLSLFTDSVNWSSSLADYPVFSFAGGGITIDCGHTLFVDGIFYPLITIDLGIGISSTNAGNIPVGLIALDKYGTIPIYTDIVTFDNNIVDAGGSLNITQRFSDIIPSATSISAGGSINFSASNGVKNLDSFTFAYLNGVELNLNSSPSSLNVDIPQNAKNGPVVFEQHSPNFNQFLSQNIKILPS